MSEASPQATLPPSPTSYGYPGARWWRMDFHTHTPASLDYANRAGPKREELKDQTAEDWLIRHMNAGIDAVVVTDHNSTAFIQSLRDAYDEMDQSESTFRPLVVFPGIELSVNGGLHLLAVFDPAEDLNKVSGLIEACGYIGTRGDSNGVTSRSFEDCVGIIKQLGGLSIAAHIDEACGLLWNKLSTGQEIRQRMHDDDIPHDEAVRRLIADGKLAAAIESDTRSVSPTVKAVLKAGLDAIEVRDWSKLPEATQEHGLLGRLPRVVGSDSHMPRDIGRNGFSIVHMTTANLEGLRMAFADGAALKAKGLAAAMDSWSVRTVAKEDVTDWNQWPENAIERITVSKMKVAGRPTPLSIPLHPKLNVFIGGRGSGKSTIVHALRLATHRERELPRYEGEIAVRESPAGDFSRWAQIPEDNGDGVVIPNESNVKVRYRTPAQSVEMEWKAEFLGRGDIVSTVRVGNLDAEPNEDGGTYSPTRFPISIYSQKQVLEMSRGVSGMLGIIDREKNVEALNEAVRQAVAAFVATRAKIRELQTSLETESKDKASLHDIIVEMDKVLSPEFKRGQLLMSQARALLPNLAGNSSLQTSAENIKRESDVIKLPDLPANFIAKGDSSGAVAVELYAAADKKLREVATRIRTDADSIRSILVDLDQELKGTDWWQTCESVRRTQEALLGTLASSYNPERLGRLFEERITLEARLEKHKGVAEEIARLEAIADAQRTAVKVARDAITEARESFVIAHNAKDTLLRMRIVKMGAESAQVERSLRDAMGVDGEKFSWTISTSEGARADSLMWVFRSGGSPEEGAALVRKRVIELLNASENEQGFADLQNNLRRQLLDTPSRREAIETWYPEDRLVLEYRTAESASWKSISQGSIGQQTAAILSFLLSFGSEPLVLDQPEDDLDTSMIMSLIVEKVRTMKEHRQIIIVTHNPNIVVHGDADLVHAMCDSNGQIQRHADDSGGLQQTTTRQFVCNVMEGGPVAFKKRFDRMGRLAV